MSFENNDQYVKASQMGANANMGAVQLISNLASGGSIGTAATTVDINSIFMVNQTTASQTLTISSPTVTSPGKIIFIVNSGSQSFTISSVAIAAGKLAIFCWDGDSWNINV